jgi:hypothetical protein
LRPVSEMSPHLPLRHEKPPEESFGGLLKRSLAAGLLRALWSFSRHNPD